MPWGSFPNYDVVRQSMLLIIVPHVELPILMDQEADAFDMIIESIPALRKWEKEQEGK